MIRPALALLLCLAPSACRTGPTETSTPSTAQPNVGYPGTLRLPSEMGPDIQWQQRVTAHWEGAARSFDAVLSKTDEELLLIGLGPMKRPGFVVRLADGEVELDNRSPQDVPFDPQYIMQDVQRVYFPWIPGEPPADGERSHSRDGERIVERWAAGHLAERRFAREDAQPPGEITVTYEGWDAGPDAPRRAVLDNGWFGYRLEIETLVQQRI